MSSPTSWWRRVFFPPPVGVDVVGGPSCAEILATRGELAYELGELSAWPGLADQHDPHPDRGRRSRLTGIPETGSTPPLLHCAYERGRVSPGGTIIDGSLPLAVLVAALAGLVSFASPCVVPLVPGYLGYVTGLSDVRLERRSPRRMMLGAFLFVMGFAVVFVLGAMFVTTAGRELVVNRELLTRVGGAVVIIMALVFLGLGSRVSERTLRLPVRPATGLAGAPILGAVFGLGWMPCTGPTLAAVMALSVSGDASTTRAVVLAVAYCVGLGLPFVVIAGAYERWGSVSTWLRHRLRTIQVVGGLLLLTVGILLVTGWWDTLTAWMQARWIQGFELNL